MEGSKDMTDEQNAALATLLRHALTAIGGFAVGKGWLAADAWQQITAAVLVLAPVAWSAIQHLKEKK